MKLSKLIGDLQSYQAKHGDIEIEVDCQEKMSGGYHVGDSGCAGVGMERPPSGIEVLALPTAERPPRVPSALIADTRDAEGAWWRAELHGERWMRRRISR